MKRKLLISFPLVFAAVIEFVSCKKNSTAYPTQIPQEEITTASTNGNSPKLPLKKVYVNNVEELYATINDANNVDATIVLAPGTYPLNASHPNSGRLELLNNMALQGQPGQPDAVVIDASALPNSSFTIPTTPAYPFTRRTGVVRMGDGNNTIEWITLKNNPNHKIRSLIQTDIATTPVAQIRIAHCNLSGSSLGINIINSGAATSGRTVDAVLEDNEISGNVIQPFKTGIQLQNSQSNDHATIQVVSRRNYIHGNGDGIVAFNSSSYGNITIQSYDDRIEANGAGLLLDGGYIENATVPAVNNSISFEAHSTSIRNNAGTPSPYDGDPLGAVGVLIRGADNLPPTTGPVTLKNNKVTAGFWGCSISENAGDFDIKAFGAYSGDPSANVTWGANTSTVYLYGTSAHASSTAINSFPKEQEGTNTATIYKSN